MDASGNGIVTVESRHTVDEVLEKLKRILEARGVTLFTVIDHSGEARRVGLEMPPTKVAIFGEPRAGTPVMQAAPSAALDLPLKLLIREAAPGKTLISFNSSEFLLARHGVPVELRPVVAAVEALAAAIAD